MHDLSKFIQEKKSIEFKLGDHIVKAKTTADVLLSIIDLTTTSELNDYKPSVLINKIIELCFEQEDQDRVRQLDAQGLSQIVTTILKEVGVEDGNNQPSKK